ncbi:helicase [Leptospira levettii]|uniref:ATP-dependent DNA helicase n=1 Tax=Leptospira levettii TaxID=2023178 RepID=UPI000C2B06AE|nr:helicase C-terminal domain-containing protein [Leptospira levettii]PJZ37150.1 helicase [Leptospira levettii]PJZ87945.1 helicase [Leptospira levettii]PKA00786.1 helicase [Leptospira levettii]
MDVSSVFTKQLPKLWKDYEVRKEQMEMSEAIESAFNQGTNWVIEAGTGVGKSLAYLIPSALFSLENECTVVVSTETKSLQDQLLYKDIPLVSEALGVPINAMVALGANNYLCKRKYNRVMERGDFGPEMESSISYFVNWEKQTESGIRAEYDGYLSNSFWSSVARESDNCLGRNCPNFNSSYYFLEKEKWKKANILIVNHHLLASHLAGDFKLLPPFSQLVIDEAHVFPEIVGKAFGSEIRYELILNLLHYLYFPEKRTGLVLKLKANEKIIKQIEASIGYANDFFRMLLSAIPLQFNQFATRHTERIKLDNGALEDTLADLSSSLESMLSKYKKDSDDIEEKELALGLEMVSGNLKKASSFLTDFRLKTNPNLVFWIEPPSQVAKDPFYYLFSQPKNTDEILANTLFPNMDSVVLTSATLSPTSGNFQYFLKEVGTSDVKTKTLSSPFHYNTHSLLFVPKQIADPVSDPKRNKTDLSYWITRLLKLSEGDAFVLFTSNKLLSELYEEIRNLVPYPIFAQTEMGPIAAKREFLANQNSVLFGVSSFWQGVDIKGDKLRNVIVTKLPFQVPTEPVLQAKMEDMEKKGKSPFWEMQVPKTCLLLRQGFGRLIRSQSDTGMVSILDPRIHTKSYGKNVLQSLPKGVPLITEFNELERKFHLLPK